MKVVVFGAGSIGCYIGGKLLAAGADVSFYGRPRMQAVLQQYGMTLSHFSQSGKRIPPLQIRFSCDPSVLADADVILLAVKSQDTETAAREIQSHARVDAIVVSCQNGVRNVPVLNSVLSSQTVLGAMVPFNVVNQGQGVFHCGTEGYLAIENSPLIKELAAQLDRAGVMTSLKPNIQGVQWGKLLMNLNNALNVLSDVPLKQQLSDRHYRRVLALSIAEAIKAMDANNIKPVRVGKVLPRMLPFALRLPDQIFSIVARGMLKMDPEARSSMWEDLQNQRTPEIAFLNGEVVRLSEQAGLHAPINKAVIALVDKAFAEGVSPALSGEDLFRLLVDEGQTK